jgi:hypothetical protein
MFAGLIRTLATIVLVWFVFRWLDRMFGGRSRGRAQGQTHANEKRHSGAANADSRKPKDDHIGDYVDFEEIEK